ncbi:MAG: AAA family ATPase [Anaerolineae bacterium]|nr:AAA family ATPase [Anaerolineae bacterium]
MSNIISIHSFRRGLGKTNLAANVAALLAQRGRRVGVLDFDLHAPTLHFVFGLPESESSLTFNDHLRGRCTIDQAAHDVTPSEVEPGRIYLVPASTAMGEIAWALRQRRDVDALNDSLTTLIKTLRLDALIVDTYAGLDEETLFAMAVADRVLILLHPSQHDYQGTAVMVDVARKLEVPGIYLVANEVPHGLDEPSTQRTLEETFDCPLAAMLPHCDELTALGSADLFVQRYPMHPFTERLNAIVDRIAVS